MEYKVTIKMNEVDPCKRYSGIPKMLYCNWRDSKVRKLCTLFCVKNVCVCVHLCRGSGQTAIVNRLLGGGYLW